MRTAYGVYNYYQYGNGKVSGNGSYFRDAIVPSRPVSVLHNAFLCWSNSLQAFAPEKSLKLVKAVILD